MSSSPAIRISHAKRNPSPPQHGSLLSIATPMAISQTREWAPPPLPPPTDLPEISAGQDPGWQWGNNPNENDFGRAASVKAGSSLLRANMVRPGEEYDSPFDPRRRDSSVSTVTYARDSEMLDDSRSQSNESNSPRRSPNAELTGERDLRRKEIEQSSHSYDKQIVNRIGGPSTPKRQSISYTSNGMQENGIPALSNADRRRSSAWSTSMPERRHLSVDSTSTSTRWPFSGTASPGSLTPYTDHGQTDSNGYSVSRHGSMNFDGSHRGSYDQFMFLNDDYHPEEGQMSTLHLHDQSPGSPKAGSKRRAPSPSGQRDDRMSLSSASGQNDVLQRHATQPLTKLSSTARCHPNHSSVSSASSIGPRHGSLGSSLGMASIPSSATSYGSERISPSMLTTVLDPDRRVAFPPAVTSGGAANTTATYHQRTLSESAPSAGRRMSAENITHTRSGSMSHIQGMLVCECCPKKPRKFDTEEDLRLHEGEKQYTCAYCSNRFKNKNEAERHQNSLHLRRHSWSCAALAGVQAAFQASSPMSATDTCGYCGQEFSNPPEWDRRAEHLSHVHKFSECNQSKKFFRADHFRQHLKHSHHGTSGRWTTILENACMKDEPPPEKRANSVSGSTSGLQAPPALMIATSGLQGSAETIQETPHDS